MNTHAVWGSRLTGIALLVASIICTPPTLANSYIGVGVPVEMMLFNNTNAPVFYGQYESDRFLNPWVPSMSYARWRIVDASGRFWNNGTRGWQNSEIDNEDLECVIGSGAKAVVHRCGENHGFGDSLGAWRMGRTLPFADFPDGTYTFTLEMKFNYGPTGSETEHITRNFVVDGVAPNTAIDVPVSGNPSFTTSSVVLSGSASDNRELRDVIVDVRDRANGLWWDQDSGDFRSTRPGHRVDVSAGSWSYTFNGGSEGSGRYRLVARARDLSQLTDGSPAAKRFQVDEGDVDTTITVPEANAVFLPRPVRIDGGRVYNGSNIGSLTDIVNVEVRDNRGFWWNGDDGVWSGVPYKNEGSLAIRKGAAKGDWTYLFDDRSNLGESPFTVMAQGVAGAGAKDPTPAQSGFSTLQWPPAADYANTADDWSFADANTAGSLSLPMPAAATDGDLLILLAGASFQDPVLSIDDPSWTPILQENPVLGGEGTVAAWWKPAPVFPTDVVVSHQDGVGRRVSLLMLRVSGAWDRDMPIADAAALGLSGNQSGGPLLEVARDRSLVLSFLYAPNAAFGATQDFHPNGFTDIVTTNFNGGKSPSWLASAFQAADASTIQPSWGSGGSSFPFRKSIVTIAVQPYEE